MAEAPDREALIRCICAEVYGRAEVSAEWIPSDEADVFRLRMSGMANRVVKFDRPDRNIVRKEALAFPALRARGFDEFPEVECSHADVPAVGLPFIVMPEYPKMTAAELTAEQARWVATRIGDFLRRLADVAWEEVPGATGPDEQVRNHVTWFNQWFDPLRCAAWSTEEHRRAVDSTIGAMERSPKGFGGWQFAQALTDGRQTLIAIDWGNLGAYWPLSDLASTIRAFAAFNDATPTIELIDTYTAGSGLDAAADSELQTWLALWTLFTAASNERAGDSVGARGAADDAVARLRSLR